MNKLLKGIALGTAAALMAISFVGCGNKTSDSSSPSKAKTTTVDYKLITDGKLVVGTNAEFPPFEYFQDNEIVGIDADMVKEIANKLNLELEIKHMDFDSLEGALTGKRIDVIAAAFSVDPDREEQMDFTDTYYETSQTIIVKSDSSVKTKDDLQDKKIGIQDGNTAGDLAKKLTDKDNVKGYKNGSMAVEALISGKIDAVIVDENPAIEYKKQQGDKITLIEGQFKKDAYAMAVSKGNKDLKDAINKALKEMQDDESMKKIVDKYIKY